MKSLDPGTDPYWVLRAASFVCHLLISSAFLWCCLGFVQVLANAIYGLFAFEPHIPVAIVANSRTFTASTTTSRLFTKHSSVQSLGRCVSDLNNALPGFSAKTYPTQYFCAIYSIISILGTIPRADLVLLLLDCCASRRVQHWTRLDNLLGKTVTTY